MKKRDKKLGRTFSYLVLFTTTAMCIACACIICFSLNSKSAVIKKPSEGTFDPNIVSSFDFSKIFPEKETEKKDDLNLSLTAEKASSDKDETTAVKAKPAPPEETVGSGKDETTAVKAEPAQPSVDYTALYPDLYVQRPEIQVLPEKVAFLTFDDGPSARTAEVLDILKERNIKATFFVTGKTTEFAKSMMRRIVDEGHTIAVHTYTHEFRQIYSSVQAYLDDFNKIFNLIYNVTGVKPEIFRFPGGSKNGFNRNNYRDFINEMTRRGFDYFDWNVSSGDAVSRTPTPAQTCVSNVLNGAAGLRNCVVLMHDLQPKTTTVQALPDIINGLAAQGFTFDKLSHDIDPAPFSLVRPYV